MREKLAKYEQIRQDIIHKIESMEYRPNQVIPSENELCASYGVSRITVRKAIDELVHEGLLYRIKGKGSFVRDHGSEGLSRIYSFTEAILHQGKTPSKKLLSLKVEEADADIRRRMGLEEGECEAEGLYRPEQGSESAPQSRRRTAARQQPHDHFPTKGMAGRTVRKSVQIITQKAAIWQKWK